MLCGNRLKIVLNSVLYNKNNLVKACLNCVVNRVIKQYFTVFAYGCYLLKTAETAAHTCRHYHKCNIFIHNLPPKIRISKYIIPYFSYHYNVFI